MDPDEKAAPRKLRFAPKRQNRRNTRPTAVTKIEDLEDDDVDKEAQELLLKHFNETRRRLQPKVENKSSVQATFINAAKQSSITRAADSPADGGLKRSYDSDSMQLDNNVKLAIIPSNSDAGPSVIKKGSASDLSRKKEYQEPWDYDKYYPITLPWRKPYSGNPDILDEVEFDEAAKKVEYDETKINSASELGFLNRDETDDNASLMLLKLPETLPAMKRSATAKGKEVVGSLPASNQKGPAATAANASSIRAGSSQRTCTLDDLAAGCMGKLLVYKSGAVKLKLGETLYDISPGMECTFAQDVVAVNVTEKEACATGALLKRAVMTPDIGYILNSVSDDLSTK